MEPLPKKHEQKPKEPRRGERILIIFAANFQITSNEKSLIYFRYDAPDGHHYASPGQQETRLDEMALSLRRRNVRHLAGHELRRDRPTDGRAAFRG